MLQSMPTWYTEQRQQTSHLDHFADLLAQMGNQNGAQVLGAKFAQVLAGDLYLNEDELNALMLASLNQSRSGRQTLARTQALQVRLLEGEIEVGAVINLEDVASVNARLAESQQVLSKYLLPMSDGELHMAFRGKPVARDLGLGITGNPTLYVGKIPIPINWLREINNDIPDFRQLSFPLSNLQVNDVRWKGEQLHLKVLPKF